MQYDQWSHAYDLIHLIIRSKTIAPLPFAEGSAASLYSLGAVQSPHLHLYSRYLVHSVGVHLGHVGCAPGVVAPGSGPLSELALVIALALVLVLVSADNTLAALAKG